MKRSVFFYVTAVVALNIGATAAVFMLVGPPSGKDWQAGIVFAFMGLLATLLSYERTGSSATGSVSFIPFLAGVLVSPSLATAVGASLGSLVAYTVLRRPFAKVIFNGAQYGLATALAVMVLAPAGPMTMNFAIEHAALFGLSALTFLAANTLLVVGVIALAERRMFWATWQKVISSTLVFDLLGLPIIALLALSYIQGGIGWLMVIVLALLGWRQLYKKNAELEKLAEDMLHYSVATIEAQDPYTSGHSQRVATYSRLIARLARIPAKTVDHINTAALLHDVGKIHVEYGPILRKPGRLTDEERKIIETHPIKSEELVSKIGRHRHLVPAIRAHHERWDGKGYPDGLAGQDIPLGARVIAIADTIDAMMSSRPYRKALEVADIRREIEKGRGSQFDPKLTDAVLSDVSWQRLSKVIRRYQNLRPGETLAWDDDDARRLTADLPVVASR